MDETTRSELCSTIRALRRTADTANKRSACFFSPSEVIDAIKEEDVCACLRLALKSVPEDVDSRKNATLVPYSLSNERDISRLAKEIINGSILIFAILLLGSHESFICEFVFRRDCDARLPFSKDALYYLNDEVVERFDYVQWEFCPAILELHGLQRTLRVNEIVPFFEQEEIGSGAYGTVWKGKLYRNCHKLTPSYSVEDAVVARKELSKTISGDKERAVLELVRELKHPNLVELLSAFHHCGVSNLIFPLADMNLREFLENRKECQMKIHDIYTSIHGLADALRKIHHFFLAAENSASEISKIGCHHDLRPDNILIQHGVFVIADFGLSKLTPDNEDSKTLLEGCQTDDYLPPEATHDSNGNRRRGSVGRASDNWAFGCILTELATFIEGKRTVRDFKEYRKATIQGRFKETNSVFHLDNKVRPAVEEWLKILIEVARKLMVPDVDKRAKASEVVLDLKVLAIESIYNAIRSSFLQTSQEPSKTFMCLEQMRVQTWWREYDIDELDNPEDDVLPRLQNLERCLQSNTVAELLQSTSSELPQIIMDSVDALCATLPDKKLRNFSSSWCQIVSDIDDTIMLSAIRQAPKGSRYREVGISATIKEMDLSFQNQRDLGQSSRLLKRGLIDVDPKPPFMSQPREGRYPDESKTMGVFKTQKENQEGERVLIEWKEYSGAWTGYGEKQLSSMDRLADLLDPDVTPLPPAIQSKVLACRGYFQEEHKRRFGFIYSLPVTDGDDAAKLFSLNDVLYMAAEGNSKMPDLGCVFQLAKDLGSCLLHVHEAGWLHKNITSHNLLIFTPNEGSPNQNVGSAVLCGFNDSRLEAAGYTLGPEGAPRHYKHPAYIKGVSFSRAFDYYSLGIVLLEMGLGITIAGLTQHDKQLKAKPPQDVWQRLLKSYVPRLGSKMGSLFRDAVQFCLEAYDYGLVGEQPRELHERFRKEVVESLALCVA